MPAFSAMLRGENLDGFHQRCVVPERGEVTNRNSEIDSFVRFLHSKFSLHQYTVASVLKSGSLGKGTAIRDSADIDLVVIMNGLGSIEDLRSCRPKLLDFLDREVKGDTHWNGKVVFGNRTQYSLGYTLNGQQVDVLPALDFNRCYGGQQEVYRKMSSDKRLVQEFSASLAPLQIDFVKPEGEDVKRVIRLMKYWKLERRVDIRSYTLELITIFTAKNSDWQGTKDLFRHVLTRLADCRSLEVIFGDNYRASEYASYHRTPYVVDPANPFMNTLYGKDTSDIAKKARSTLNSL